jgi:hypothetical protein
VQRVQPAPAHAALNPLDRGVLPDQDPQRLAIDLVIGLQFLDGESRGEGGLRHGTPLVMRSRFGLNRQGAMPPFGGISEPLMVTKQGEDAAW